VTEPPDIPSSTPSEARGHQRRLARSTAVFSLATAVSRVLGLVREMVSAYFFGVSGKINAFTVAIQIPNLVRALVADAAHGILTRDSRVVERKKYGRVKARRSFQFSKR